MHLSTYLWNPDLLCFLSTNIWPQDLLSLDKQDSKNKTTIQVMVKTFVPRTFLQQNLGNIYNSSERQAKRTEGDSLDMRAEVLRIHLMWNSLTRSAGSQSTRAKWRTSENLSSFVEFCKTARLLEYQDTLVAIMFYLPLAIEESLLIT